MSTVITGATGFVGRRLVQQVDQPVILSRNAERARQRFVDTKVQAYDWNPDTEPPPAEAFDGANAVIHLAGESVGEGRWTRRKKERILESRVRGTRHLVEDERRSRPGARERAVALAQRYKEQYQVASSELAEHTRVLK